MAKTPRRAGAFRYQGGENGFVEIVLQETPQVRIRVSVVSHGRRGDVVEVRGLDGPLTLIPLLSNQVLVDSGHQ